MSAHFNTDPRTKKMHGPAVESLWILVQIQDPQAWNACDPQRTYSAPKYPYDLHSREI